MNIDLLRKRYSIPESDEIVVRSLAADWKSDDADDHAFSAQITAAALDRDDEVLLPTGCDASAFDKSGSLFWNHDYDRPIGFPGPLKQGEGVIVGTGTFLRRPDDYQGEFFPDFVRAFVSQAKALGRSVGVSVGFIPTESRQPTKKDKEQWGDRLTRVFSKWKLLEWSIAPVQSNPEAFTLAVGKGLVTREQVKVVFGVEVPETETVSDPEPVIVEPEPTPVIVPAKTPATRKVYIIQLPPFRTKPKHAPTDIAIAKVKGRLFPDR